MATQIGQIMHAMEQDFDEKQLRKLIRKFDADGSGKLEFDEFCALVYTVANTVDKETLQKELREAFRLFDKEVTLFCERFNLHNLSFDWECEGGTKNKNISSCWEHLLGLSLDLSQLVI